MNEQQCRCWQCCRICAFIVAIADMIANYCNMIQYSFNASLHWNVVLSLVYFIPQAVLQSNDNDTGGRKAIKARSLSFVPENNMFALGRPNTNDNLSTFSSVSKYSREQAVLFSWLAGAYMCNFILAIIVIYAIVKRIIRVLQIWLVCHVFVLVLLFLGILLIFGGLNYSDQTAILIAIIWELVAITAIAVTIKQMIADLNLEESPSVRVITFEHATAPLGILNSCVRFIEEEGLETRELYRLPGSKTEVDTFFSKFDENPDFDIQSLNLSAPAVASAFKELFFKRLPPIIISYRLYELKGIAKNTNKKDRSQKMKQFLTLLPLPNSTALRIVCTHLKKVSENSDVNSMTSADLANCWWPSLFAFKFSNTGEFQQMERPISDLLQSMIDECSFFFGGYETV